MKERKQSWYSLVSGAWGGLNGWLFGALLFGTTGTHVPFSSHFGYGALIGGSIGLMTAGIDSISSRSLRRLIRQGGSGALAGSVGGMLVLPLAELIYRHGGTSQASGFTLVIRAALCWALLGAAIGIATTLLKGTQRWKGALGGFVGGVAGGLLYESLRHLAGLSTEQLILSASLALLGGTISLSISTISALLSGAWLEVATGKMAGRQFDLTKFVTNRTGSSPRGIIGSDEWKCHVHLPGDQAVFPVHAWISLINGIVTIEASAKSAVVQVNGERVGKSRLEDGDRLQIGSTILIYRQKKRHGRT
jgi:hypothetical protein